MPERLRVCTSIQCYLLHSPYGPAPAPVGMSISPSDGGMGWGERAAQGGQSILCQAFSKKENTAAGLVLTVSLLAS